MKLSHLLFFAALAASARPGSHSRRARSEATLRYIHAAWDSLTRSVTDCQARHRYKDRPSTPGSLICPPNSPRRPMSPRSSKNARCKVVALPRRIQKLGDVRPEELPAPGLLYLPNPYVVPGGRFNEMYGWDSYFILLGLEVRPSRSLAKGIVDNFLFEVENYGSVLNANRTYYLTRSQPPFLTSMIRAVYEDPASFPATPAGRTAGAGVARPRLHRRQKDYSTWTRPEHRAGSNRPRALLRLRFRSGAGDGRRQHLLPRCHSLARRASQPQRRGFLVKGSEHPDAAEAARLKQTSCDVRASVVCLHAWFGDRTAATG